MTNIVIVGATGAVGKEMLKCLKELEFPIDKLRLVASERSAGKILDTPFGDIELELISEEIFQKILFLGAQELLEKNFLRHNL